ncbi:carbohydrate ABC transporter permease [Jatrophihabitans sp. GAS493]|uniref:carbohydrate ABC transporter permease n=1 Tax=Jatrophihabitans sp. GAS493 TaxID=1907575 RepID=UPI001A7E0699|nr:sugar ABC transporter permease [Jatrophihabitans sp. GAS493]
MAAKARTRRPATILPRNQQESGKRVRRSRLRGGRRTGRRGDALIGWTMIAPSVLLIGIFGLIPVIWSFALSFQKNDLQTPGQWIGFKNYRKLVHDPVFVDSIRHTIVYTLLFVPITLVLSLLVAAALNRRIRGMTVYRLAVFIPVVTSTIATGVIFTWLMDPNFGLINVVLHKLHLPTFGFFADPNQALYSIVIMTVWGWVGFGALIFLAGLQSIPQDLVEAAQIDGCSKRGAFWRIQVPLMRPVSGFLLVWLTINALQLFDEVYATTKGGPLQSTMVVVYYLYTQAFQYFHAGYAAAIAVLLFLAIIVISVIQLRITRDPLTAGEQ